MTQLTLSSQPVATHKVDALVLPVVPGDPAATLSAALTLPRETATHLAGLLSALGASGKADEVHVVAMVPGLAATKVVLAGIAPKTGTDQSPTADSVRMGVGAALRTLGKAESVAVAMPAEFLDAAAQGALLGSYRFTVHKGAGTEDASAQPASGRRAKRATTSSPLTQNASAQNALAQTSQTYAESITMVVPGAKAKDAKATLTRAQVVAGATAYARDLVNTPPNLLFPQSFVESVQGRVAAGRGDIEVVVHDEAKLAELGCGGILGVGQGSSRPPRIVELHYRPRRAKSRIAFVGKGITFDTGGVCIKPAASMLTMKSDMAGAAAAAAAVLAAAELELPTAVSAYLCLAENMPGGNAQRPGDIVTMRNGTTVEIIDTDAEGRMVLADGMVLAAESGADAIVDIATLTGACMVALGTRVAGLMGNDDALRERIIGAARTTGEALWPLPLPEDLRAKLDSAVADLQHKGDQYGGALTAGLFLREFARDGEGNPLPWAHLDIAGPSFTDAPTGHLLKGGTGYAVPTLIELASSWSPA